MIKINLLTYRNSSYRKVFEAKGFSVTEFSPGAGPEELKHNLIRGRRNYSIFEINDEENTDYRKTCSLMQLLYSETKLICLAEKITPPVRRCLLETGVTDCLTSSSPERAASYIETLEKKVKSKFGSFLILDDNEIHRNMLRGIIKRFGYKTEFIKTKEELLEKKKDESIYMILINLGTKKLDLNGLVRESYAGSDIRRFPIITYKDMTEGLFVHEFINGLNKLTKVVLSPQELFSVLVDLLFKKEIMTEASSFNKCLEFEKYGSYSEETISQIYYEIHRDLCSQPVLFSDRQIEHMLNDVDIMKNTLIRVDGIRWLKEEPGSKKKATCGVGV